jgi:hypothetical protein
VTGALRTDATDVPAPAVIGTLDVADWRHRVFALYEGVRATARTDVPAAHTAWIEGRDQLFREHPASPLPEEERAGFPGLPVAPYDPSWRFEVRIEPAEEASMEVDAGSDGTVHFDRLGIVAIPDVGTLDVWLLDGYGGGLFVPFRDGLSGAPGGSYGGGRYLLDTIKGAHLGLGTAPGSLVLDFNFAYHPSCAYDSAWTCPLAPPGNRLEAGVPVGERLR